MHFTFGELRGLTREWKRLEALTDTELAKELDERVLPRTWADPELSMLVFVLAQRLRQARRSRSLP